jgi:flagellar hook-associated protein 1 FlgK
MAAHPEMLALAGTRASDGPPPVPNTGDNSIGQDLYDLLGTPDATLNNQSFSEYWLQLETTLAGVVREESQLAESSQSVVNMLEAQMSSVSGVNLDDELLNLMGAQKAYEACARVMSTASDLLETLINLGR